jgi:hypothetical protein
VFLRTLQFDRGRDGSVCFDRSDWIALGLGKIGNFSAMFMQSEKAELRGCVRDSLFLAEDKRKKKRQRGVRS